MCYGKDHTYSPLRLTVVTEPWPIIKENNPQCSKCLRQPALTHLASESTEVAYSAQYHRVDLGGHKGHDMAFKSQVMKSNCMYYTLALSVSGIDIGY